MLKLSLLFHVIAVLLGAALSFNARPVHADTLYAIAENEIWNYDANGVGTKFASGLNSPRGLAFDDASNLYVTNSEIDTITKFANAGGELSSTGKIFASGLKKYPADLAFDGVGNLYVANLGNGIVMKFESMGGVLSNIGTIFFSRSLSHPVALAFDGTGNLYMANNSTTGDKWTITKFTNSGGVLSPEGKLFSRNSAGYSDLAFDGAGNLYVVQGVIAKFVNTSGVLSNKEVTFADQRSGLKFPRALAFDNAGNLFVADSGSGKAKGRIMKFAIKDGVLSKNGTPFASNSFLIDALVFDLRGKAP